MRRATSVLGFVAAVLFGSGAFGARPEYTVANMNHVWAQELEQRYLAAGYAADVAKDAAWEDAYLTKMSCLNNVGQMAGQFNYHAKDDPLERAVLWDPVAGLRDLGIPGDSFPQGMNDLGQVVGMAPAPTYSGRGVIAFLWDPSEGVRDLGDLSPVSSDSDEANGINNSGQVVGSGYVSDSLTHLFLWDATNGLRDLSVPMRGAGRDLVINESAQISGNLSVSDEQFETHPFLLDADGVHDLHPSGYARSFSYDMNNLGQVVGSVDGKACLWSDGEFQFLDGVDAAYPWADGHFGWCVNDSGLVLGRAYANSGPGPLDDPPPERYFLWDERNGVRDLESLVPADAACDIIWVYDMNDRGWVLAQGWDADRRLSTFLLKPTAIPEPSGLACFAAGLATLALLRRRPLCAAS